MKYPYKIIITKIFNYHFSVLTCFDRAKLILFLSYNKSKIEKQSDFYSI